MNANSESGVFRGPRTGAADGSRTSIWFAGCIALLVVIAAQWARTPSAERFRPPTSPLDRVGGLNEAKRLGWGFLWQVREVLPPGSTYTILAADTQTEMSLYMMSLAVLPELQGMPTSYYERPTAEVGAAARYLLVYRCSVEPAGATLVQKLDDGCIWERSDR